MNFFSPAEVAKNFMATGKSKVSLSTAKMLLLGIMAGMFIAFGAVSCTTIACSIPLPSVAKFVGAAVFPGGLAMVLVAGSELFTGNCLLIAPLLTGDIKASRMLKNWLFVYIGNLIGSLLVGAMVAFSHQPSLFSGALAVSVLSTAVGKVTLSFGDALIRGILCNFLVCTAVWMSFAAKDVVSKIVSIFFPIMMFVGCGFEHSIANMYFVSVGLFSKQVPTFAQAALDAGVNLDALTWVTMFTGNLIPVTLGNIIGGGAVAVVYWFCYLRKTEK